MKFMLTLVVLGLGLTAGCNQFGDNDTRSQITDANRSGVTAPNGDEDDDAEDQKVALADLPAAVRAAVLAAVSGMVMEAAELEVEDGVTIYSIEGTANGVKYCIEVSPDGKVLKTETEDEDEDDEDEDDDDEDEDEDEDGN